MKLQRLNRPFEVRSVGDDGSFSGYATVFNTPDCYGDIIMPGALTKTLAKKRNGAIPVLWQHSADDPIGAHINFTVDKTGLLIEGQLIKGVQKADEAHLLLKAKVINGISMGFVTVDADYDMQKGIRSIAELDLWENSLVTFPAQDNARVTDVKSLSQLTTLSQIEEHLRDAGGFTRKEAKLIVSCIKSIDHQRDADNSMEIKKALSILKGI